jgi:hypothetical protein
MSWGMNSKTMKTFIKSTNTWSFCFHAYDQQQESPTIALQTPPWLLVMTQKQASVDFYFF